MERHSYPRARLGPYIMFALLATAELHAQTVVFVPLNQISVGTKPDALVLADIEGDGKPDLLVVNQGSSTVSVLRSLGNGFFEPLPSLTTGESPDAIAVGDFNNDGRLDLAIANFSSSNVTVLLGNGNGTFSFHTNLTATSPSAIAVADFNADGNLDLAVVETNSSSVAIFLGNGAGTFTPFFTANVGTRPVSIAAADFNGDGKLDLAVVNSNSNDVSILLGNGNGTFQDSKNFAAGESPASVALGDFDDNGTIDLALANATGSSIGSISLLLGVGNGTFQPGRSFTAGSNPTFLVAGDFNLDGELDLAVANSYSNTISIFSGVGNGTFLSPLDFTVGNGPAWIGVVDLTGDGKPDLVVANGESNTTSVLINHTLVTGPTISSVVGAALSTPPVTTLSSNGLFSVFGSGLAMPGTETSPLAVGGVLQTIAAQTCVQVGNEMAPLIYVSPSQINAQVPAVASGGTVQVSVITNCGTAGPTASAPFLVSVASVAPEFLYFVHNSSGQNPVAATDNTTGAYIGASGLIPGVTFTPAQPGEIVTIFAVGLGQTTPPQTPGALAVSAAPVSSATIMLGGSPITPLYVGVSPGFAGLYQINFEVPNGLSPGPQQIQVSVDGVASPAGPYLDVEK